MNARDNDFTCSSVAISLPVAESHHHPLNRLSGLPLLATLLVTASGHTHLIHAVGLSKPGSGVPGN